MSSPVRVVKLGGSLLSRADLLDDFLVWQQTSRSPTTTDLVLVGGGEMVDAVRRWDALRPVEPADVHWLCVDLLQGSFAHLRLAVRRRMETRPDEHLTDWLWIQSPTQWCDWLSDHRAETENAKTENALNESAGGTVWLNVPAFYRRADPEVSSDPWSRTGQPGLPEDWTTTTDAIAWWLGVRVRATRCVLLKSCDVPESTSPEKWIEAGIIDPACRVLLGCDVPLEVTRLPSAGPISPPA